MTTINFTPGSFSFTLTTAFSSGGGALVSPYAMGTSMGFVTNAPRLVRTSFSSSVPGNRLFVRPYSGTHMGFVQQPLRKGGVFLTSRGAGALMASGDPGGIRVSGTGSIADTGITLSQVEAFESEVRTFQQASNPLNSFGDNLDALREIFQVDANIREFLRRLSEEPDLSEKAESLARISKIQGDIIELCQSLGASLKKQMPYLPSKSSEFERLESFLLFLSDRLGVEPREDDPFFRIGVDLTLMYLSYSLPPETEQKLFEWLIKVAILKMGVSSSDDIASMSFNFFRQPSYVQILTFLRLAGIRFKIFFESISEENLKARLRSIAVAHLKKMVEGESAIQDRYGRDGIEFIRFQMFSVGWLIFETADKALAQEVLDLLSSPALASPSPGSWSGHPSIQELVFELNESLARRV